MNTYISMLRGINLGSHNKIPMAKLRSLYESLGCVNVQTYIQSGNVVFDSLETDRAQLAESIKAKISEVFGYSVPVFIVDAKDLEQVIQSNPFLTQRNEDPTKLHITFLQHLVSDEVVHHFVGPKSGNDEFIIDKQVVYIFCPDGYGRTKLTNNLFEQKLKVPATTRNWNTVNALYQMTVER